MVKTIDWLNDEDRKLVQKSVEAFRQISNSIQITQVTRRLKRIEENVEFLVRWKDGELSYSQTIVLDNPISESNVAKLSFFQLFEVITQSKRDQIVVSGSNLWRKLVSTDEREMVYGKLRDARGVDKSGRKESFRIALRALFEDAMQHLSPEEIEQELNLLITKKVHSELLNVNGRDFGYLVSFFH